MAAPPEDYPITGICVVADPDKCPPGYNLLLYSTDRKDDCDMWKDSFFKSRVTRYLCVTRVFPLEGGHLNNVLVDVVIQNEKELPPNGYSLIENTIDTSERATRKKQISVRLIPRNSTTQAICKLIILSKNKRAPADYQIAGEINGLLVCFKFGEVPASKTSPTTPTTPVTTTPGLNNGQANSYFNAGVPNTRASYQGLGSVPAVPQKPSNNINTHPLSGVPFEINPKYVAASGSSAMTSTMSYRSYVDIENEYTYPFRLERSVCKDL